MGRSPEGWRTLSRPEKATARRAYADDVGVQPVQAKSLGVTAAAEDSTVRVYPREAWEPDLQRIAGKVEKATGKPVTFVLGAMKVNADGVALTVRGVNTGKGIIVQADDPSISAEKIATHEAFHAFAAQDPELSAKVLKQIRQQFPENRLREIAGTYLDKLYGIVDLDSTDKSVISRALERVRDEICADAYAGINAFSASADEYTGAARQAVTEARRETAAATERKTGPPAESKLRIGNQTNQEEQTMEAVNVNIDEATESANAIQYSADTWNESDYVKERKAAAKDLAKRLGISEKKALKFIDDVNGIAKMIVEDRDRLDYEASPGRSSFIGNTEYGGTIDFSTICKKYGIKKQPTLLVASGIHSPAAFGIFRRKIVLPDIAFSENGLVGTLAHEVTHCKRGDLYMKLIELIACSLNWFNPLVHIAAFKCEMEMELSCDEKVLSGSSEAARAAYADVMLDIIRRCRRNRGALTTHFNPKKSAVTARFKNILYGSGKRRGRILIGVCLVLCILAGAFVACQTEDDLTDDHWYAEGYYLKCDNGSDVIVMDADGANPASPCQMTPADDSVSFEGLTDGDRIKVEISMIMTTYPGQTEVYSIEKLSDGERDDIDPAVLDSLRELGWIDAKDENKLPDNFTEFYHEAEAVYALFTGYRSDIYSIGTFSENGAKYRSVDINGYTTLAELRAYCEQYFGSELTDELMSKTVSEQHPLYREHKGKLFRFDGYTAPIGYDVGQNYSMILERVEHDVYTVRIDAIMLENGRDIPAVAYCSYTLSEDGEIRFTSFELMAEKLFEALEQIAVENDPSAFNPDAYAALIPNSSADRLFWHQIAGTDDYLYFCAIRRINSTMTSYTDDPPKDFAIYHINSSKMDALGYIEAKIPADIVYDTVCPVVAMTGFGPMSCKFILQMTDGDRVFYVAFDNFDNLQQHLSFTYRGILSDDEVNALKGKYPVSFDKASKYYMGIPKEQYCFEYQGVQYDLSKIYSEVNGIKEWGHIGKYVVAQGHINPNDSLYVLINTETQKIEHHFVAAVMTYHSEDINTIMYARGGTVASLDGKFLADIVLGPYEYIRKLEYSEDKTQIIVTIETKDSSVRTTTFELAPVDDNTLTNEIINTPEEQLLNYDSYDVFEDEIYLCNDVYRSDDTLTHGTGSIELPRGQDALEVKDYDILLCDDGCDPTAVVSRASQGYAPVCRIVADGEIDGNYKVLKFKMEIPEQMLEGIKKQGAYEQMTEKIESQYFYLLVLDEKYYAYIHLERIEGTEKLEYEAELADSLVKNARINYEPRELN